jgi:hypothetical protein
MKFLTTWGEVESAVALMSVPGGKRIAIGGISRGRWCGPHHTSGQGCRCSTDRGHQYSRLHVGIPSLWKTTALTFLSSYRVTPRDGKSVARICQIHPGLFRRSCTIHRKSAGGCDNFFTAVFGFLLLDVCPHLGDMSLPLAADFLRPRRSFIFGGISLLTELVGSCGRLGSRAGEVGVHAVKAWRRAGRRPIIKSWISHRGRLHAVG